MKTGWAPGMLQDDCRELSKWLSTRVDSRHVARQAAKEIEMSRAEELAKWIEEDMSCQGDAEIAAELRRLDAELSEEQRLNGMGAERELALMAKLEAAERENAKLREELEAIYSTEPVAWMLSDKKRPFSEPWPTRCDSEAYRVAKVHPDFSCAPLIPLPVRKS